MIASASYILDEAIDPRLALNAKRTQYIQESLRQAEAGQVVSHDAPKRYFEARIQSFREQDLLF